MKKNFGYIFALLASFLWGSMSAVGKLLLTNLDSLQVLLFTNLFAFLGLFMIVLFQKKKMVIRTYKKQDYFTFAWMGFIGVFLYPLFFFGALKLLPAQEAFIINYLWPILVVVFAVLILKERITLKKTLGIIFSFLGIVIVITNGDFLTLQFSSVFGILLAIAGAIVYGLFSVLGKRHNYDNFISMMFYYFFSLFYALIAVLVFSKIPAISVHQFFGLIWLGFFTSGLGVVFWFLALKHGDTAKISSIIFITPFVSLIYIYFIAGEKILISSILGLVFISIGIFIQSIKKEA